MTETDRETLFILDGVEFGIAYIASVRQYSKLRIWTQRVSIDQWLLRVEFESFLGGPVTKIFQLYWPRIMKTEQEERRRKMLYDLIIKALREDGVI